MARREELKRLPFNQEDAFALGKAVIEEMTNGATFDKAINMHQDMIKSILSQTEAANKKLKKNSGETVHEIIDDIEKNAARSSKHMTLSFQKAFDGLKVNAQQFGKVLDKHLAKPRTIKIHQVEAFAGSASAFSSFRKDKDLAGEMIEALGVLRTEIGKMAPALAAISGVATVLAAIINKVWELDQVRGELSKNFGGNMNSVDEFVQKLHTVSDGTNLAQNEVLALGQAFHQAGIPIVGNTKDLESYMIVAGNLTRIFGTSNEAVAGYTRTLKSAGLTSAQIFDTYDELYQEMQKFQLTVTDLNNAMSEGDEVWKRFGSISGETLDQVQRDVLDAKGLFRAFNIDIKNTGSLLGGIFGDPKMQRRQATLIASQLHVSGAEALSNLIMSPKQGQQDLMQAAITMLTRQKDLRFDLNHDQLMNLSPEKRTGILLRRQHTEGALATQFGMSPEMVSQMVSGWESFTQKHPGKSVEDWVGKSLLNNTLPGAPGSLRHATDAFNNSIGETAKNISNKLDDLLTRVGSVIVDCLPPLLDGVNNIVNIAGSWANAIHIPWERSHHAEQFLKGNNSAALARFDPARFDPPAVTATKTGGSPNTSMAPPVINTIPANFGHISRKYESGGRVGAVNMDPNRSSGMDYGMYQFNQGAGIPQQFVRWAQENSPETFAALASHLSSVGLGTRGNFGKAWQALAKSNPTGFRDAQHRFAVAKYLDPLTTAYSRLRGSPTLQEDAFATAIQTGPAAASMLMKRAGIMDSNISNAQFIKNLADVKSNYYPPNAGRYQREAQDELAELLKEQNAHLEKLVGLSQGSVALQKEAHKELKQQGMKGDQSASLNQRRHIHTGTI